MNDIKLFERPDAPPAIDARDARARVVTTLAGQYSPLDGYLVARPPRCRRRNADLLVGVDRSPLRAYCVETRDSLADEPVSRWRSVALLGEPNADECLWVVVPQAQMAMTESHMAAWAHLVGYAIEGDRVRLVAGPSRGRGPWTA